MNLSQNFQRKGGRYYKKSSRKAGALQVEEDFDRTRFGGGAAYRQGDFRATLELVKAEGMIPNIVDSGGIPGTLGSHYYFTPTTRLMFNYEIRDNEAPNLADNAPQNIVLDTYDDRVSVQLFWMF